MEKASNGGSRHDEIAKRAYLLWEQAGKPAGQDMAFWLKAEEQLRPAGKPVAASKAPKASAGKTMAFAK